MILVQWSCNVPQEKLESFLKFVEEKMKPFYEFYSCKQYELFMPMEEEIFFLPFYSKRNRYIEQVVFDEKCSEQVT